MKRLAVVLLLIGFFWFFGCLPKKNAPPIADFTFAPSAPEAGESITFDATPSKDPDGQIKAWEWQFGDGSTSSGMRVSHSYDAAGSYTVTLKVKDDKNATHSTSKTITVRAAGPSGPQVVLSLTSPTPDPTGLAWDGEHLWLADAEGAKIYKLDPQSGEVLSSFDAPGEFPVGLAWGTGVLWVAELRNARIYRLDPQTGQVLAGIDAPQSLDLTGLAWDGVNLWLGDAENAQIHKIDPQTGQVVDSLEAPGDFPEGLAWDGSSLWNVDAEEGFFKLDTNDGEVLEHIEFSPTPEPRGLVWDGANLWLVDAENAKILKLEF